MTDIPEQATIKLPNLQRSALRSLLDRTRPDYSLDDLLQLVITKGIASLVSGRELREIHVHAEAHLPTGNQASTRQRVAADYVGFFIEPHQQTALKELEER